MTNTSESKELTRAISFARQGLQCAFGSFVSGEVTSVTGMDDMRDAREALALLEYLSGLARILLPLTGIVPELQDICLRWVDHKVTRVEGKSARERLARVLKAVDRIEDKFKDYLTKAPPFASPRFIPLAPPEKP